MDKQINGSTDASTNEISSFLLNLINNTHRGTDAAPTTFGFNSFLKTNESIIENIPLDMLKIIKGTLEKEILERNKNIPTIPSNIKTKSTENTSFNSNNVSKNESKSFEDPISDISNIINKILRDEHVFTDPPKEGSTSIHNTGFNSVPKINESKMIDNDISVIINKIFEVAKYVFTSLHEEQSTSTKNTTNLPDKGKSASTQSTNLPKMFNSIGEKEIEESCKKCLPIVTTIYDLLKGINNDSTNNNLNSSPATVGSNDQSISSKEKDTESCSLDKSSYLDTTKSIEDITLELTKKCLNNYLNNCALNSLNVSQTNRSNQICDNCNCKPTLKRKYDELEH